MHRWKRMRELLRKVVVTLFDIGNFAMLLFLFVFIYALLGMQFFANELRFDSAGYPLSLKDVVPYNTDTIPLSNFDTFLSAFATVFQVLTSDNWNTVYFNAWRATSGSCSLYFVTLATFGTLIMMNLFLAILLTHFIGGSSKSMSEQSQYTARRVAPAPVVIDPEAHQSITADVELEHTPEELEQVRGAVPADPPDASAAKDATQPQSSQDRVSPHKPSTFFLLGADNPVRMLCSRMIENPSFDQFILVLICISSVSLAMDSPLLNPNSTLAKNLNILEYVLTFLFVGEMCLKIVATGFIFEPGAYLRNNWNVLDCAVVVVSVVGLFMTGQTQLKALRSLRALRGLRPLRMIQRAPGLKVVVNALFAAIPDVLNVGAVCLMFFLIFAIFATNFLKGQLRACQGTKFDNIIYVNESLNTFLTSPSSWSSMSYEQKLWFMPNNSISGVWHTGCSWPDEPCCDSWTANVNTAPTSKQVCACWGAQWDVVVPRKFDNVMWGLMTFFEISTTEGWTELMWAAVDSTGIDMQPIRNNNAAWIFFFITFMLVASYMVMNLFVGVVIENFNRMRLQHSGMSTLLTEEQQGWVKTQEIAFRIRPKKRVKPPEGLIRFVAFKIVTNKYFEAAIMTCILLNTIGMAMEVSAHSHVC
jgi:hypothetical protein